MKSNGFFAKLTTFHNYVYLATVYSCGLRLNEGLSLEVSDIDSDRMMIHVNRGKGAKDRYVSLPHETLSLLRKHWNCHRHPQLIFPAMKTNGKNTAKIENPMAVASVQGAFRSVKKCGIILASGSNETVSISGFFHSDNVFLSHFLKTIF